MGGGRKNMLLEKINGPEDVKALTADELSVLADEVRRQLLSTVSVCGGHLASNLCVVELTIALHRVFNSPKDKIIFDVGHQSYVHKLLTGRRELFGTLRQTDGISGFPMIGESEHDAFGTGHSSTSISAAVGIAAANKLSGSDAYTVAVVGDGAFTGGMIYEALNNCSGHSRLIIVLNDNDMSISANVGGMSKYFSRVRTSAKYFNFKHGIKRFFGAVPLIGHSLIKGAGTVKKAVKGLVMSQNFFEHLGINYYGPLDGHDIKHLELVLREAMDDEKCSIIHICTTKGKGYPPAESSPDKFHGVSGFDIDSGEIKSGNSVTFSDAFGRLITDRAENNEKIVAVTASMEDGTGLTGFASRFPDRFFDVGIAEQHAVTFSCGLATAGMIPVFAVYSTFAQRAYDQILHDAAIQKLHVIFMLDRAGLVGNDGVTHHGLFDVSSLAAIPGIKVFAPADFDELERYFDEALAADCPVVIRYPKGGERRADEKTVENVHFCDYGVSPDSAFICYGRIAEECAAAAKKLCGNGISVRVIRLSSLVPLDYAAVDALTYGMKNVLFAEEGIRAGGIGERYGCHLAERGISVNYSVSAVDGFPKHGSNGELLASLGLDSASLFKKMLVMMLETNGNF